jgi:hypothetical protein
MQQSINEPSSALEARLLRELAALNRQISELEKDKISLERILVRIRKEGLGKYEVNRKNSAGRLLIEKAILDRLREAQGRSVAIHELWKVARRVNPLVKEGTFRSYIHRMKARQEIEAPSYGNWRILNAAPPLAAAIIDAEEGIR